MSSKLVLTENMGSVPEGELVEVLVVLEEEDRLIDQGLHQIA